MVKIEWENSKKESSMFSPEQNISANISYVNRHQDTSKELADPCIMIIHSIIVDLNCGESLK